VKAKKETSQSSVTDFFAKKPPEPAKKVAGARAGRCDGEVVLRGLEGMDAIERLAALDAITRRRMHLALLDVWQRTKRTIVFVTHDIMEALTLADRIAMMSVGPGSRIEHLIEVDVPRPRNPGDPRLGEQFAHLEHLLHGVKPDGTA